MRAGLRWGGRVHRWRGNIRYRTTLWGNMKARCYDRGHERYRLYGGRGIKVCDRWRRSFAAFLADMGGRPGPECSIDRIDRDGNYEPGNCWWASPAEQRRYRSTVIRVKWRGEELPLYELARMRGLEPGVVRARYRVLGWSLARSLGLPQVGADVGLE